MNLKAYMSKPKKPEVILIQARIPYPLWKTIKNYMKENKLTWVLLINGLLKRLADEIEGKK